MPGLHLLPRQRVMLRQSLKVVKRKGESSAAKHMLRWVWIVAYSLVGCGSYRAGWTLVTKHRKEQRLFAKKGVGDQRVTAAGDVGSRWRCRQCPVLYTHLIHGSRGHGGTLEESLILACTGWRKDRHEL